jgi:hypothetical protein
MKASLFKDLARSGWHSSIMTTYSVDPAFYDGSIEYRLCWRHSRPADFWADCTIDTSGFVRSAMPLLTVNVKNILAEFTALAPGREAPSCACCS